MTTRLADRSYQSTPTPRTQPLERELQLGDLRYRKLIGNATWSTLPSAIRRRFSKRLEGGHTAVYVGRITEMRMSMAGIVLAQVARLIGAPLPTSCDTDVPSIVTGGQVWTRLYAHRRGFPQVIHSSKRFSGPTGLEEHIGMGFAMTLKVTATPTALLFNSDRYFITIAKLRFNIPRWLCPGHLTVGHHEIDPDQFSFTLDLVHPFFGTLVHQRAIFKDADG